MSTNINWNERLKCKFCGKLTTDPYMVKKTIWDEAQLIYSDNVHLECLERKLGRYLKKDDFVDCELNYFMRYIIETASVRSCKDYEVFVD